MFSSQLAYKNYHIVQLSLPLQVFTCVRVSLALALARRKIRVSIINSKNNSSI